MLHDWEEQTGNRDVRRWICRSCGVRASAWVHAAGSVAHGIGDEFQPGKEGPKWIQGANRPGREPPLCPDTCEEASALMVHSE